MAEKRNFEGTAEAAVKKPKPAIPEGEILSDENKDEVVETRVLIDNHEAGIVIGRGGANVTNIRKETSAFLSILKDSGPGSKERVLVVKGTTGNVTAALSMVVKYIIDAATERAQTTGGGAPETHAVKLLVHKFLAGSIIGKGGEIIKKIMADTECKLQLSNDVLPGSTEKTCTVTGTPETVAAGLQRVLDQIRDNPLRSGSSNILYVPGMAMNPYGAGAPPNPYAPYGAPPQQQLYAQPYGAAPGGYGAPAAYGAPPAAAPAGGAVAGAPGNKTEKIVIPTVCTGSVIGKGGSIIRDIKQQSATFISISDPEPTAPDDRVVSVTGSAQGIQTAIFLIRQRVEAYQPPGMSAASAVAAFPPVYQ